MRWAVTGTSRGIGLEFCRQLVARGEFVEAGVRRPDRASKLRKLADGSLGRLRVHSLDVVDDLSVRRFGTEVGSDPLDVLINNAGFGGDGWAKLDKFDVHAALRAYDTNALGPLRVTRALLPQLRKARRAKVVHITSVMGSIEQNTSGGSYGYRMSKAALNMAGRSMSVDLREHHVITVLLHPGWVRTDLGGRGAPVSVEESVQKMLRVIDALTEDQSGSFFDFEGRPLSW
jgi:NAD(P)-dependent dehydrogenase (short-subunit alcohol dehydrogenase family)